MAKPKKSFPPPKPISQATATPSTPSKPAAPTLIPTVPLAHYLSILPLQHAAILFCLLQSSSRPSSPSSPKLSFFSKLSLSPILSSLVDDPITTLSIASLTIAFVQTYFGVWVRGIRRRGMGLDKREEVIGEEKEKTGFFGAFGKMRKDVLKGKKPTMSAKKEGHAKKKVEINLDYLGTATLLTLVLSLFLHVFSVLLGAPLLTKIPETYLLSLLISILAFLPLSIAIPPFPSLSLSSLQSETQERYIWLRLFTELSTKNEIEIILFFPALGAIIGAWSGALPIPLDWDRPWQAWPTTPVVGTLVGHAVGSLAALGVCLVKAVRGGNVELGEKKME